MVMVFSFSARSAQAEERQDEHDDDDQTDEINETIHGCLLNSRHGLGCFVASRHPQNPTTRKKVPALQVLELGSVAQPYLRGTPKISPAGAGLTLFFGSKLRRRITF